jgi:hypothetical protein
MTAPRPHGCCRLDHVHLAVGDPIAYADHLQAACGLEAMPLGVSPTGIASWIVPLCPPQHILISAALRETGHEQSQWHSWLAGLSGHAAVPIGWAIECSPGTGLESPTGCGPTGVTSLPTAQWRWWARSDAVPGAMGALPILITYDRSGDERVTDLRASFPDVRADNLRTEICGIVVGADEDRLDPVLQQLPPVDFQVARVQGPRALRGVWLQRDGRRLILNSARG